MCSTKRVELWVCRTVGGVGGVGDKGANAVKGEVLKLFTAEAEEIILVAVVISLRKTQEQSGSIA